MAGRYAAPQVQAERVDLWKQVVTLEVVFTADMVAVDGPPAMMDWDRVIGTTGNKVVAYGPIEEVTGG